MKRELSHGVVEERSLRSSRWQRFSDWSELARALENNPNLLHRWRREIREGPGNVFPGHGKRRRAEDRIADLQRKVGQQTLEIDF